MKEDTILNALLYLFKHHVTDHTRFDNINESISYELSAAGFGEHVIQRTMEWIKYLQHDAPTLPAAASQHAYRVYNTDEHYQLNEDCLAFIRYLETEDILDPSTREVILHQVITLSDEGIDVSLIKWVTLMVLYSMPERHHALQKMQFLVLDQSVGGLH